MYLTSQQYQKNVFINCPFVDEYNEIFNAIIFTIIDCSYNPRCALEIANGIKGRLEKILDLIKECQFGIHDLSRTTLDEKHQLPRFNMPFELGIFFGAQHYGGKKQRDKNCLILDSMPYRYQKFISDIAGRDIQYHANCFEQAIQVVEAWLQIQTDENIILPNSADLLIRYQTFQLERELLCKELKLSLAKKIPFTQYRYLINRWIKQNNPQLNTFTQFH